MEKDNYSAGVLKYEQIVSLIDDSIRNVDKKQGNEAAKEYALGIFLELEKFSSLRLNSLVKAQFDKMNIDDPYDEN